MRKRGKASDSRQKDSTVGHLGRSHASQDIVTHNAGAVAYDNMPKCTNKWGTPNKYDKDTGNNAPASITKSLKTDHTRTLRSHISTLNP